MMGSPNICLLELLNHHCSIAAGRHSKCLAPYDTVANPKEKCLEDKCNVFNLVWRD
jgi:hypothetical protein